MPELALPERASSTALKHVLLHHGARVEPDAAALIEGIGKVPVRVRSGSCGGLDVVLPGRVYVNIPVRERFAQASPVRIAVADDVPVVVPGDGSVVPLELVPSPAFQRSGGDASVARTGQVCFDRLGIGLTNRCTFWKGSDRRCAFCSIGLNIDVEDRDKTLEAIGHAAEVAFADPINPPRHVLLGGGTPPGADAGAAMFAAAARVVRSAAPAASIYVMLSAPDDPEVLLELAESGVDELGINLEVFDESEAARHLPAKFQRHPRSHVMRALERAVEIFGPVRTRSILVVGLEPLESTVAGVRALAERGVMPILSPLRPLDGTLLEHRQPPDPASMDRLAEVRPKPPPHMTSPWDRPASPARGTRSILPGTPRTASTDARRTHAGALVRADRRRCLHCRPPTSGSRSAGAPHRAAAPSLASLHR
jgi:hypothetical protein